MPRAKQTMDGNTAAAHVAYAYTDVAYSDTHGCFRAVTR